MPSKKTSVKTQAKALSKLVWPSAFISVLALGFISYSSLITPKTSTLINKEQSKSQAKIGDIITAMPLLSPEGEYQLFKPDGQLRILYFGYTHCPDVCPTSLSVLATALYKIKPEQVAKIKPVFITVDPKRDTPKKMAEFAAYFHPKLIGLTGEKSNIDQLGQQLGVLYKYVQMKDSAMEYAVDHSSYFYLVSNDGRLLKKIPHTYEPQPIIDAINEIFKSS